MRGRWSDIGAAVIACALIGAWWLARRDGHRSVRQVSAGAPAVPRGGAGVAAVVDPTRRQLLPGVAPYRIAGHVTFAGAPVAGAAVWLSLMNDDVELVGGAVPHRA